MEISALPPADRTVPSLPAGRWRWRTAAWVLASCALFAAARTARAQTARFRTLHSFSQTDNNGANTEGAIPAASLLVGPDGNFYGTAEAGGANGSGTVFRCTPGGTASVVHAFGPANGGRNTDGANPVAALIEDAAGNLYGTASSGGANGAGTAFEVTPAGGFTDLHDFASEDNEADGSGPRGPLLLTPDGELAGTASGGGNSNSNGALFFLNGTTFGSALDFGGSLGTLPLGPLAFSQPPGAEFATIYGACGFGGNFDDPDGIGSGVIFGLAGAGPDGSLQAVYTFSGFDSNDENADGVEPSGGVTLGSNGNLYGTTLEGGPNDNGTAWQIVVDPDSGAGSLTVLHAFDGTDGSGSVAPLVEGSDGSFYGTTANGGGADTGVVFRVTAAKGFTVMHAFSALSAGTNSDGANPQGGLVEVRPGSFVGTASQGGTNGQGTIFEVDVPPVVTSAATASGNAGSAFSYQITAADGPGSYSVSGLGDGLRFNAATGLISGTPAAAATLHLTVSASNDVGTGSKAVTVTIKGAVPVVSGGNASAKVGQAFMYSISATNGPTSYGATGLPSGLSVNKTSGVISGTPASTAAGTKTIHLSATNANGTGTATLTLTIAPPAPVITSPATATATEGAPFSYQIKASNQPTSYNCTGKPPGLSIDTTMGLLSGTPTVSGTKTLTLSATNAGGTGTATLTLTITN